MTRKEVECKVSPELLGTYKRLESLSSKIRGYSQDSLGLGKLQGELNEIDSERKNNAFGWTAANSCPPGQAVVHQLLAGCYREIESKRLLLEQMDEEVSQELESVKNQILGVMKDLPKAIGNLREIGRLQGRLNEVEDQRVNGVFGDTEKPPAGQAVIHDLLNEAHVRITNELRKLEQEEEIDMTEELVPIKTKILDLIQEINDFHGDSNELKKIQSKLCAIDNSRSNGVFLWQDGKDPLKGQAELHELLHSAFLQLRGKCGLAALMESRVDSELLPIRDKLTHILKELHKAKTNPHNLNNIKGLLIQIDSKRVNGVFVPEGSADLKEILPGQGALHELLHEAFALVRSLQNHTLNSF